MHGHKIFNYVTLKLPNGPQYYVPFHNAKGVFAGSGCMLKTFTAYFGESVLISHH